MKRFLNSLLNAVSAFCLTLTVVSCMSDSADHCPAEITARFSYTFNAYDIDRFDDEVTHLHIYIFGDDRLIATWDIGPVNLGPANSYTFRLDEGAYRIIAMGNLDESSYEIDNPVPAVTSAVMIVTDTRGEAEGTISDLFYGSALFEISNDSGNSVDVSLVKNTNNINVLLPASTTRKLPDSDAEVRITSSNGAIDFENNTVERPAIYKPEYSKTLYDNAIYDLAAFKVLKLSVGDDTVIRLTANGTLLREDNLVELLTTHFPQIQTDQDLLRYSDYMFVYRYDEGGSPVLSSITAGDWTKIVN